MLVKITLIFAFILFIIGSIIFEKYSIDTQLFHVHQIVRGTLSFGDIDWKKIKEEGDRLGGFEVGSGKGNGFWLKGFGERVFKSDGENFLALVQGQGDIRAHGDSFYKIKDKHSKTCINQQISHIQISNNKIRIQGNFLNCKNSNYTLQLTTTPSHNILLSAKSSNTYNRIIIYFEHKQQNNYYGLGQQFSYLNLGNNRPYSLFVREKGVGRSDQPQTFILNFLYGAGGSYYNSYSPAPIWICGVVQGEGKGVRAMGYYANSSAYIIWMNNFIYLWDSKVQVTIITGNSVKQIIKKISQINGYTPPVPEWVNSGAIVGLQGGTQTVMRKYQQLKKAGAKISGLWLQDWVSKRKSLGFSRLWWNWQLDKTHYPNWSQMKQTLQHQNISLLIYINPMLTNISKKQNYTKNYHKQAKQNNYFITQKESKIFQTSAFSDWSASLFNFYSKNQNVNQFYKNMLRSAIQETGARGLMVDFGEAYPVENMDGGLEEEVKRHNQYPTVYHKIVREVLDQYREKGIYTFSRAGYLQAPKYTLSLWAGDQSMNFKKHTGLPSCLTAMLSSSLIGYSNTHCDIGGYSSYQLPFQKTSVRTEILMTRWMQLAAFSPVFRTHEGNLPQKSLQVYSNEKIAQQFAFYSQIYSALALYRRQTAIKSQKQGLPLIRPFFIQNPNNTESYKINDQYYIGQDILICPILTQKNTRKCYIPEGQWIEIWNNKQVKGCQCYQQSKTFLPLVLIKQKSMYKDLIVQDVEKIIGMYGEKIGYLREVGEKEGRKVGDRGNENINDL